MLLILSTLDTPNSQYFQVSVLSNLNTFKSPYSQLSIKIQELVQQFPKSSIFRKTFEALKMTIHNPNLNPAQNIYNAPTQPQYAVQSHNRTIPLNQGQDSVHVSASLGGAGVQSGAAQNYNVSGGAVSNSGGGNTGQSVARSSSRGQFLNNGGRNANGVANRGGASQNTNTAMVVHGHAQVQHPQISPVHYGTLHPQYQHVPYQHTHIHQAQVHPQGRDPYPYPNIPFHCMQPHAGGLLGTLVPYVPLSRTGPTSIPRSIQGVISPDHAPRIQIPAYPIPYGYHLQGNMAVNGWDSRCDGSNGFRGRGTGSRGGRGRGARDSRRR